MLGVLLLANYQYKILQANLQGVIRKGQINMKREELYEMMDGNLGYAYVYEMENSNKHVAFMFDMTPKNIANFIGKNAYTADKVILTDMCDQLILESTFGGFIMNCPDQELCKQVITHLAPIQQGEVGVKNFPVATRDEFEELWNEEEMEVMQAGIKMM